MTSKIRDILKHKSIPVSTDAPILVREAAFLPVYNPTREIDNIRKQALEILRASDSTYDVGIPEGIHSTILRFREVPSDKAEFVRRFEQITKECILGNGRINSVYITEETKPYMREAHILDKIELGCDG